MDNWFLYDENMALVKKEHPSTHPIPDGLYHLTIEVWTYNGQAFYLTQRSMNKKYYPGYWECTGGSAIGSETTIQAAIREIKEELGITVNERDLKKMAQEVKDHHIVTVYILCIKDQVEFHLSEREIIQGKWFTVQELESLHIDFNIVPHQFERYLKHIRKTAFANSMNCKPKSIKRLLLHHDELAIPKRGLPHSGCRPDGRQFSQALKTIDDAFLTYGDDLYTISTQLPESINNSLGSGNPLKCTPFPPIIEAVNNALKSNILSQYPLTAGDLECRKAICRYLHKEGFSSSITAENIIFTSSTTQAYNFVLKLIIRPGDAVVFTGPTYGLFVYEPERLGGESVFLDLCEEDNWLPNPQKLAELIKETNERLMQKSSELGYAPCVVAFLNENPHNPTGKVMGNKERKLLEALSTVCAENNVLIIDDLIYRDIGYDRDNLALPLSSFENFYRNTVSLLGLSKSFGVAGLRAGMIVADEAIIRGIRNIVYQEIDSSSFINAVSLSAAFNDTNYRMVEYDNYFSKVIDDYLINLSILKGIIDGIESVDFKYRERVIIEVKSVVDNERAKWLLSGIKEVHFINNLFPESGFFCLLDFTSLKGKTNGEVMIQDDISLLRYLFRRYRINFITGKSIGWPKSEQIIARLSYSVEREKFITILGYMKEEIEKLS